MSRLLDPKKNGRYPFKYRRADKTNLAARFRLERIRIKAEQLRNEAKVAPIKRKATP